MDHTRFKANHTAALYVSGGLDEHTQETFELHLMSCPRCVEDVELWRAMRGGVRQQPRSGAVDAVRHAAQAVPWRIAASFALIAIGSGAAGWYGRTFAGASLTDDALAVFELPPVTRGHEDCAQLRVTAETEIIALRVPNAAAGWQLELADARGVPLGSDSYTVRAQADGSWLLRMRVDRLRGELLRLQSRAGDGITEPIACAVIPAAS